ncbi:transposase [Sphingobium yanoikuyae]|uniref:transposase n=1 Tax=Sphingobium yanoikuyae TaxID=13690 RepID=UPI002FDAA908
MPDRGSQYDHAFILWVTGFRLNLQSIHSLLWWGEVDPSRESQNRVSGILSLNERMTDAYAIKETFYYFYDKATRVEAEEAYTRWVRDVRARDRHKDWQDLMRTVARNRKEIFNYFDHRFTSGKVERMNRSIADINRAGNGMDFETLRAKALLRYGRMIPPEDFTYYCIDRPPADPEPWPAAIISTPFAG